MFYLKEKISRICDRTIEICLYLMLFCLPFAKAGVETFLWTAILAWIVKKVTRHKLQVTSYLPPTELNKALGIFILVNALSVLMSINFGLSIRAFFGKTIKLMILYFMVVETINNKQRLKNILIVMVMSAILITADSAVQYFSGKDFLRGFHLARLRASFSSSNGFAGWLIILIPIFSGILATKQLDGLRSITKKIPLTILVILLLICLMLTYSRGAWLGFIASLGLIFYYIIRILHYKVKILTCFLIVVFFTGIIFITPGAVKSRIKSIGNINSNVRTYLWKESLSIIEDFPIFGCGLNTYSVVARNYKIMEGGGIYPHNSFLHMAAEIGIVGLISFLWIVVNLFKIALQGLRKHRDTLLLGMLAGILGFLVQAFFDTTLYSLQLVVLFWFIMGLTGARIKILNSEEGDRV